MHVNISSPNFLLESYTLSVGQTSFYNTQLKIYVAEINKSTGKIWVDIAKLPTRSA